jgi:hypothetical protein
MSPLPSRRAASMIWLASLGAAVVLFGCNDPVTVAGVKSPTEMASRTIYTYGSTWSYDPGGRPWWVIGVEADDISPGVCWGIYDQDDSVNVNWTTAGFLGLGQLC